MTLAQSEIKSWLGEFGQSLINNGYMIHPVPFKSKGIFEEGWQRVRADAELLDKWLADGRADEGVSLLTGHGYVAVDIDTKDPQVAEQLTDYCIGKFGQPLIRYGNKPKVLLLYRCDERLSKMRSATFECWQGGRHAVEILAVGQQFVAFNVHPETNKPYTWRDNRTPADVALADIRGSVDHDGLREVLAYAEQLFESAGMEPVKGRSGLTGRVLDAEDYANDDEAQFLAAIAPRLQVSQEEVVAALKTTRRFAVDYDNWVAWGMALHHQFEGDETGFKLWNKWSQHPQAEYPGETELRKKWESFKGRAQYGQSDLTFRFVLAKAEELREAKRREQAPEVLPQLKEIASNVVSDEQLTTEVIPTLAKRLPEIDAASRVVVANVLAQAAKDNKCSLKLTDIRRLLGLNKDGDLVGNRIAAVVQQKVDEIRAEHPWAQGIYWVIDRNQYASAEFGMMSDRSVRALFGRRLLNISEDKRESYVPEARFASRVDDPVWFLDNVIQVPHVHAVSYAPGHPGIMDEDGVKLLNSFRPWFIRNSDESVDFLKPVSFQNEWSPKQRAAVKRFQRLLLSVSGGKGHETEAAVLTSWIAARFQDPSRKNMWSPFLWGPKGSGKSSLGNALQAIFTPQHCIMVSTSEIVSSFSGYAGQACIAVVDEADLTGHRNREDVATRLRPHITANRVVRLEKGQDGRNVPNYQDYLFMGNRPDGIPIDEGERRFLVLSSEFKTREQARRVMINEGVGEAIRRDLEDAECVAALRGFLFEFDLHPSYNHGDPIDTDAKKMSTEAGRSAIAQELLDMVEDDRYWFATKDFVSVVHVRQELLNRVARGLALDVDPRTNRNVFGQVLGNEPFNMIESVRVECDGDKYSVRVADSSAFDKEAFKALVRKSRGQDGDEDFDDWKD